MLDRLCRGDESSIENRFFLDLAGDFIGFLEDAVDRRTIDALGLLARQLKNLFQALYVILCLAQVSLETLLELRIAGFSTISGKAFTICFSA